MVTNEATKPPTLTMPVAVPSRLAGLNVRAKSKPIIDPGPPQASARTRTTITHQGQCPGQASTSVQAATFRPTTVSTSHDRRSGCRWTSTPTIGPVAIPTSTNRVNIALAVAGLSPSPATMNGNPQVRANTVPGNWVVK